MMPLRPWCKGGAVRHVGFETINSLECLDAARKTSDLSVRSSLLGIAQKWLDEAELSEHGLWNEALRLRALQAAIGQELRALYETPPALPHSMLAVLIQLDRERDNV
jgi:hypothetical protein